MTSTVEYLQPENGRKKSHAPKLLIVVLHAGTGSRLLLYCTILYYTVLYVSMWFYTLMYSTIRYYPGLGGGKGLHSSETL